jgi:thymidylate synthase (FAD)
MSNVTLQWVTPNAEFNMAYIARGSNPPNQNNPEFEKLFRYCLRNDHWSPFQMASMCLQFETSLAIAAQVKRHWSLAICEPADIQETSMRYLDPFEHDLGFQPIQFRKAASSNRQSSEKPLSRYEETVIEDNLESYFQALRDMREVLKELNVANECIRMLYPQATTTRFFIAGSCRSWIHYFEQRLSEHAQLEHQELGLQAWDIFEECFPTVASIVLLKGGASVEAQTRHVNKKMKGGDA